MLAKERMRTINYKRSSMCGQAIGCAALAIGGAWFCLNFDHWQVRLFCGLLAISLPFLSIAMFRRASGPGAAFAFDSITLTLTALLREAEILWLQVN
jgi:hypothetical protein